MTPEDSERFAQIQRETAQGYAVTFKDLVFLVRLVVKLDRAAAKPTITEELKRLNTVTSAAKKAFPSPPPPTRPSQKPKPSIRPDVRRRRA
jgi:hypothetical protein